MRIGHGHDLAFVGRIRKDFLITCKGRIEHHFPEDFAFSDPYYNAGQVLIVPAADTTATDMADLDGRTLAVELGAQGHVEAMTWSRRLADLTVTPYDTPDDALAAVANGEAAAALVDNISAGLYLRDHDTLRRTAYPVTV